MDGRSRRLADIAIAAVEVSIGRPKPPEGPESAPEASLRCARTTLHRPKRTSVEVPEERLDIVFCVCAKSQRIMKMPEMVLEDGVKQGRELHAIRLPIPRSGTFGRVGPF